MYGSDLSEAFLHALRADGRSPRTINVYRRALARFGRFLLDGNKCFRTATQGDLVDYRCLVRDEHLADRTQHLYAVIIRCFYKWAHANDHIESDPSARLKRLKAIPTTATPPSREDFESLVASIPSRTALDFRDRAILLFLFSSGLRVSELCSLKAPQIDLRTGEFMVLGKGNKRRKAVVTGRALEALCTYIWDWRPKIGGEDSDWLWLSSQKGRLTAKRTRVMMERRRIDAGIESRITYPSGASKSILAPHAIRHLHATAMFQAGVPLPTIQASLGHASLSTTQIYLDVSMDDLRQSRATLDRPYFRGPQGLAA